MLIVTSDKHNCKLFLNDDSSLIFLPCLFSYFLSKRGVVFHIIESVGIDSSDQMKSEDVTDETIKFINNRLMTFLLWVEEYSKDKKTISLITHHNLPEELINTYLSQVIIDKMGSGKSSVDQHLLAIRAYYNYLAYIGVSSLKRFFISPQQKRAAMANTSPRNVVRYLTPELRSILIKNTTSLRNELLIRTGCELGLRSKENTGLLINDFVISNKKHNGLKSLFEELDSKPNKIEFEYLLQGKYSKSVRRKGGKARSLYIHRSLLERLREYFKNERPESENNTFFLNNSSSERGTPISYSCATTAFREVRNRVLELQLNGFLPEDGQALEKEHTHHVLRHSFATDKFYDLSLEKNIAIDDVTTTSVVYLTVAALMGHTTTGADAIETTKRYIQGCHIKLQFES